MKANDKPQFSAKWWAGRPKGVKGSDLEKALKAVEKALLVEQKKETDARAVESCIIAVKAVGTAATKTIKQCKKKHKNVIAVLKKFDDLVKSEVARLEETRNQVAAGDADEDDEESEGKLFEKAYLYKQIKRIKSGGKELNFSFGLDVNAPEDCILLLHRKKNPQRLFKILKRTKRFPNRLLTYGTAKADSSDRQTLVFHLAASANTPPKRIVRIGRKLLLFDKNLRFKKLKVVAHSGESLNQTEPHDGGSDEEIATRATSAGPEGDAPTEGGATVKRAD